MREHILLLAACLASLALRCAAEDVQSRARALFAQAHEVTDIRIDGAQPFRLRATFSFVGEHLEPFQGTYTEVWASRSDWRRETAINDQRRVDVGVSDKRWILEPEGFPVRADSVAALMTVPSLPSDLKFRDVVEREMRGVTAECAESKARVSNVPLAYCFEKKTGMLLERVSPLTLPLNVVASSCQYGDFRKFGDHWFPRQVECFEDRHKVMSVEVVELSAETTVDSTLFAAPKDAIEFGQCLGKRVGPAAPTMPNTLPDFSLYARLTKLWFVVDVKGRAQGVRVVSPSRGDYDETVVNWVEHWKFSPGKCDGKPIAMEMTMDVPSTHP